MHTPPWKVCPIRNQDACLVWFTALDLNLALPNSVWKCWQSVELFGEYDDDDDDDGDDDDDDYDDNDIYIYFDDDDIYVGDVGGSGQLGIPSEPSNQSCSLAAPLIGPVWRLSDRRKKPKNTKTKNNLW